MIFNTHSNLDGFHAPFSPSQSSWLRYTNEEIVDKALVQQFRTQLGTELHDFAADQITLRNKVGSIKGLVNSIADHIYCKYKYMPNGNLDYAIELIDKLDYLPNEVFDTIKMHVNDGIGYRMTSEQILYFSDFFYGTTDAIAFSQNMLRIHDLKTGAHPAHIEQLLVYAALFCLEYKVKPSEINTELRLYQFGEVVNYIPEPDEIDEIMEKIQISNDAIIAAQKEGRP